MAQNFDQYMAESGQQSTLDQLRKNFQYDAAKNQYESQGWYGMSPQQRASQQSQDAANAEMARQRQLTDQAIGTLQSQKPVIGQIYGQKREVLQSQIDPTKQRYDALIADLKNQQTTSEESGRLMVNREMAKRGVTQSSGLSDQTMLNTLNPIRRNFAGLIQQTGLQQESDIKSIQDAIKLLFGEQAGQELNLAGLISQAQMGGAGNALTASSQLLNSAQTQAALAQQQAQAKLDENYRQAQLAMSQQLFPEQLLSQQLSNQAAQAALNKPTGTGGTDWAKILQTIESLRTQTGGKQLTEPKPSAIGGFGRSNNYYG